VPVIRTRREQKTRAYYKGKIDQDEKEMQERGRVVGHPSKKRNTTPVAICTQWGATIDTEKEREKSVAHPTGGGERSEEERSMEKTMQKEKSYY